MLREAMHERRERSGWSPRHRQLLMCLACLLSLFVCMSGRAEDMKGLKAVSILDANGTKIDLYEGSYALLVGVGRYTGGWPSLDSVPNEVAEMDRVLIRQGFAVTKVLNPDSATMKKSFEDFIDAYGYNKNNRLLFFFSGHGYTLEGDKGYLVPGDAPDPRRDEIFFLRKALGMTQVRSWCQQMRAKHVIFLFDSCFSGTIFKTRDLPEIPPHISALTANPVRQFISAGTAGQSVPAHSVFVPVLVKGLNGAADLDKDNYITGTELGLYLQKEVTDYSVGQDVPQTPQYGKIRDPAFDEGDFVFMSPDVAPPVPQPAPAARGVTPPPKTVATTGELVVTTEPEGALVTLARRQPELGATGRFSRSGASPARFTSIPIGPASLVVTMDGYETRTLDVEIGPGQQTQSFTLVRRKAASASRPPPGFFH